VTRFTHFELSMGRQWPEILEEIAPRTAGGGLMFNPANFPKVELVSDLKIANELGFEPPTLCVR
jgi:hypothetical protein